MADRRRHTARWLLLAGILLLALLVAPSAWAGTFTVNTDSDSGAGSLRAAINSVDNASGASTIVVAPMVGTITVELATSLPQITNPVTLEGAGITINDTSVPIAPGSALTDALVLQAGSDGSTVSGLTIVGAAGGAGISIVSSDDTITGNTLGSAAAGNEFGITVFSSNNTIGGTAASAGNVISGNTGDGIFLVGPARSGPPVTGNVIEGNTIGSTTGAGNGNAGVEIGFGATDNTVGGAGTGAGNVISGNGATGNGTPGDTGPGVLLQGAGTSGNTIENARQEQAADRQTDDHRQRSHRQHQDGRVQGPDQGQA